jgi:hypothetical protein
MVKFFTKMMCVALLFALCAWSLNAQDSNKTEIRKNTVLSSVDFQPEKTPTFEDGDEIANSPSQGREKGGDLMATRAPIGENRREAPVKELEIPNPGGRGPNTSAYLIDHYTGIGETVKAPLNNPGNITHLGGTYNNLLGGGDWINGKWYAVECALGTNGICEINPMCGTCRVVSSHTLATPILGMAYYDAADLVYVNLNSGTNGAFYKLDIATGATQYAFTSQFPLLCFTITTDGRFIGLNKNGPTIVEVNPTTGACTTLINLPFTPNYVQDMAIDRETNTVYWAAFDGTTYYGTLYRINLDSKTLTNLGDFGYFHEMTGFAIPNTNTAKAPTNLEVIANSAASSCNVFWINPTHTVAGDPLTSITKMVLERNGTIIQEFPSAVVGGSMSFTDDALSDGQYCYTAYAVTSEGNGVKACE